LFLSLPREKVKRKREVSCCLAIENKKRVAFYLLPVGGIKQPALLGRGKKLSKGLITNKGLLTFDKKGKNNS
jgi:hypothetical protein